MTAPLSEHWANYHESRATEKLTQHSWNRFDAEFQAIRGLLARHVGEAPTEEHLTQKNLRKVFATYSTEHVVHTRKGLAERSASTVAGCMSTWSKFLQFLVAEEMIPGDPMAAMKRPRVPKSTPKALQEDSVERLVASLRRGDRSKGVHGKAVRYPWPQRDLALLVTYATTGGRQQEIAMLNIGDVDIRDGGRSRAHIIGKGSKERWQTVPDETVLALAEYMETRRARFPPKGRDYSPNEPLLVNDRGGRLAPSHVRYIVGECYSAAGVRSQVPAGALVHALRHTFATRLAGDKNAATIIKEALGHESLNTSQRYITVEAEDVRKAVAASSIVALLKEES